LKEAKAELQQNDREEVKKNADTLESVIRILNQRWRQQLFQSRFFTYGKYILPFVLLLGVWFILFLIRPYYLFKINERISQLPFELKLFSVGGPLRYLLLVGFFQYRRRVLDAWVARHVENARLKFSNRNTVKERTHYVPIPVELDGKKLQLKTFAQQEELPSAELVRHLLKHKRIMIIIDGFSEFDESVRKRLMTDVARLPVNALIFTSRHAEHLEDYAPASIQPMKIGGEFLSDFLGTYLTEQGVRNSFDDEEFFDLCRRISLLSNSRLVTAYWSSYSQTWPLPSSEKIWMRICRKISRDSFCTTSIT
jgi:hypothetical protein